MYYISPQKSVNVMNNLKLIYRNNLGDFYNINLSYKLP